ncbi:MAG: LysR family transcriptional regulator [Rubrivivax sp.]
MNIGALSTLAAVLRHGRFAAAAAEVGCTPSAVSLQMKQLESHFGQPLFDRSGRSVQPTPFALELGSTVGELVERLQALRARPQLMIAGRWRLGCIASAQADALPQALRLLRDRHPALTVVASVDDSAALLAELKAGRIDAALVVRPPTGGSSRLAWHDLARQPFVLLAPAAAAASAPRELLRQQPWIRYDPALTGGKTAAGIVRRLHPQARPAMDLKPIDAIVAMVGAGLGVSVVPQPRPALLAAHAVQAVALGRRAPVRQLAYVCRAADAEHRNGAAVVDALQRAYAPAKGG